MMGYSPICVILVDLAQFMTKNSSSQHTFIKKTEPAMMSRDNVNVFVPFSQNFPHGKDSNSIQEEGDKASHADTSNFRARCTKKSDQ